MSAWEWPQWTYAALYAFSIIMAAAFHGTPRQGNHNVLVVIVLMSGCAYVLHAGGFW